MNTYKIFFLSVIILISKLPLKASDGGKPSAERETKSRYHIAASYKGIFIEDKYSNQTLSVEAPEWLRKQDSSCQAKVAIDPDNRFFYLYNPRNCTQYALGKNELFKAGVSITTKNKLPYHLELIKMHKDKRDCARIVFTTLTASDKTDISPSSQLYTWDPTGPRSMYLIQSVSYAYNAFCVSKGLLTRTDDLNPDALNYEQLLADSDLKPKAIERIYWWIENYLSKQPDSIKKTRDFCKAVAKAVFEEAYAGQLLPE